MNICVSSRRDRILALVAGVGLVFAMSLPSTDAEARPRKHRVKHARAAAPYAPPFAALVVDANTGKTLYAKNENELRHPASVTKVMTLYMLFEQLEKGRMSLDTPIRMTAHAASMAPSKLGLRPGATISAEDAIKALVTKSANDVAAAIADHIGGSEARFAEMMTAKAHSIGMSRTNYANASGLPNPRQITTARDLVLLGRAIQERFPKYYAYFSTHNFRFAGASIRNHNNLLGRLEGVDGIKTGYTAKSGFNLLTSVRRDGQHVVAAVLGGTSAASRDRIMAELIEDKIQYASNAKTALPVLAQGRMEEVLEARAEPKPEPKPVALAVVKPAPMDAIKADSRIEAIRPEPVKTETARLEPQRPIQVASTGPVDIGKARPAFVSGSTSDYRGVSLDGSTRAGLVAAAVVPSTTPVNGMRWVAGPAPAEQQGKTTLRVDTKVAAYQPQPELPHIASPAAKAIEISTRPAAAAKGYMIQIGATDGPAKAQDLLDRAKSASRGALKAAVPFTEKVSREGGTMYRARFAGLSETQAEAACKSLKRSGMGCFTTRN
ncbi:MAG: Serine-type D-Ala-D-Ala carboxypeptidase [Hyphomicrobiales bacterium]|nr:Serine-type D-Ala-D-Ala carboxypeptidase [Hyphomicrobiales bacterium]